MKSFAATTTNNLLEFYTPIIVDLSMVKNINYNKKLTLSMLGFNLKHIKWV